MARIALEIPKVGLVMENARLVRWLKNVGDPVKQGDPVLELETEKSVVEIEATDSGRLVEILLHPEQAVSVGDRVAWLEVDAPLAAPPARIRSSPVARRMAAEAGIELSRISGTGPRGRVQLADVRRAIETNSTASPVTLEPRTATQAAPVQAQGQIQPLSSMRRALARSMTLSNATVPQFNVERAVDLTVVNQMRARLDAELPPQATRPTLNDFLLQATARTLLAFPALNCTFVGDPDSADAGIAPANGTHIGLVVAVENGLLVPVLHDVERLELAALAHRRRETVQQALRGRLKREELDGATFSISNLGVQGPDRFTAVINPPQSAILAVGRVLDCVVASGGGIHIRPLSRLTLTVDHRVADGRLAADFLAHLVEILQSPTAGTRSESV